MKIISKFHDYYDSCLAYGQDSEVVYQRQTQTFDRGDGPELVQQLAKLFRKLGDHKSRYFTDEDVVWLLEKGCTHSSFTHQKFIYTLVGRGIIFCGKYYPVLEVLKQQLGHLPVVDTNFLYTYQSTVQFLERIGVDITKYKSRGRTSQPYYEKFFEPIELPVEWLVENKVTAVSYSFKYNMITINPNLGDLQFFKVMDPYTTFQELTMWVAGTLAYPHNMMLDISDKSKVAKHGFDQQYGFRTRPHD